MRKTFLNCEKPTIILIWGIGNSILCEEINFGCEEWSRFASEIRDKAITKAIPFDDYYTQIQK